MLLWAYFSWHLEPRCKCQDLILVLGLVPVYTLGKSNPIACTITSMLEGKRVLYSVIWFKIFNVMSAKNLQSHLKQNWLLEPPSLLSFLPPRSCFQSDAPASPCQMETPTGVQKKFTESIPPFLPKTARTSDVFRRPVVYMYVKFITANPPTPLAYSSYYPVFIFRSWHNHFSL